MKISVNYLVNYLVKKKNFFSILFLFIVSVSFFWKYFFKNLIPLPADIIVGIYFPWRDQIWNGYLAGVPFKNGHLSDIVSIIYPWRIYGISLLKQGIAPLWIPHTLGGTPLLANFQSGLAYPLNFLFWLFNNTDAWSLYIIFQPVLASIFSFLYLRNLKISTIGSLFGSVIFAFSGFSLVWLEYGIVGHAGLWLPLILLSIDKLSNKNRNRWLVLGGTSLGFSFLAGYPQISIFIVLVIIAYSLYSFFFEKNVSYLLSMVIILLGIALAAVQLIPGFELINLSIRQTDPTAAAFNYGILPLKNFVLALVPDFFGNPATGNYWDSVGYNESAFYVGIIGLVFALISIFKKERKEIFFFFILLIISLLFVFDNPLAKIPQTLKIPGLAAASAGRYFFLATFSLGVLASFGVDTFLKIEKKLKIILILSILILIFGFIWLLVFANQVQNIEVVKRNLILPSLMIVISGLLLSIGLFLIKFRKIILVLLLGILIFDLFRFGWKYNSFSEKEFVYPETKLTEFLKEKIGIDRFNGVIPQSMFIPYNLSSPEGYEPLMIKNFSELANQINRDKFVKVEPGSRWVTVNRNQSPLLDLLGTKYLLSFNGAPSSDFDPQYFKYPKEKYSLIYQYGFTQIYENKNSLPRIFIAHNYKVEEKDKILKEISENGFNYQDTLLFSQKPEFETELKQNEEKLKIDEELYWKNQIVIETSSDADGYLFISDNNYPGWQAQIDGKETIIYEADYTFKSIFLPKGNHTVRFIFMPQSFRIGLTVSLITLVVLLVIFIKDFYHFKRS